MKIISHRGYWKTAEEKNSELAFRRSFELGFGTETDVRDAVGKLVISHDMPSGNEISFADFLALASSEARGERLLLALNIKADGLAQRLQEEIKNYPQLDCFVFDMAVPDMRGFFSTDVPVFTRMSEVEREPAWLERAAGVWLDAFDGEWYRVEDIRRLLDKGLRVCIVSAELHGRSSDALWNMLLSLKNEENLVLCTDFPEKAALFFGVEKEKV